MSDEMSDEFGGVMMDVCYEVRRQPFPDDDELDYWEAFYDFVRAWR